MQDNQRNCKVYPRTYYQADQSLNKTPLHTKFFSYKILHVSLILTLRIIESLQLLLTNECLAVKTKTLNYTATVIVQQYRKQLACNVEHNLRSGVFHLFMQKRNKKGFHAHYRLIAEVNHLFESEHFVGIPNCNFQISERTTTRHFQLQAYRHYQFITFLLILRFIVKDLLVLK